MTDDSDNPLDEDVVGSIRGVEYQIPPLQDAMMDEFIHPLKLQVVLKRFDAKIRQAQRIARELDAVIDPVRARLIAEGKIDPAVDLRDPVNAIYTDYTAGGRP